MIYLMKAKYINDDTIKTLTRQPSAPPELQCSAPLRDDRGLSVTILNIIIIFDTSKVLTTELNP